MKRCLMLTLILALTTAARADAPKAPTTQPYEPDPEIVKMLDGLQPGHSMFLPPARHKRNGEDVSGSGRSGPYARDYTMMMVWAPDRGTAFYAGGNHGAGRTNDVWEYHLPSNTWHNLFPQEGGDHARFKWTMMFAPRMFAKDPNYKMTEGQKANFEACKKWWKENVVLKDGMYVTKGGGPLLHGHTWDTLVYEPLTGRMIQGTGAYCANAAWLESKFSGRPIEQVQAEIGKAPDGTPYRSMWIFDPDTGKWSPYAHESELAKFRGMGATMTYISDWKKVVFYVAAANVSPPAAEMVAWDPVADTWEQIKPNGGKGVWDLAFKEKIAPTSEQQTAYSPRHRKLVAVLKDTTYAYDIDKNEWSKLNESVPFMAHDAKTVFAYDSNAGVFLLADPKNNKLASFDPAANEWKSITPEGPGMHRPKYCVGKGYYDPARNALVVQGAFNDRMWVYRHAK